MEENRDLRAFMERMEEKERKRLRYTRLQCCFVGIAAACCLALLVTVCSFAPRVRELTGQAGDIAVRAEALLGRSEGILTDLESVAADLAELDVEGTGEDLREMVNGVNGLVTEGQAGIGEALEKIDTLDIDTLNSAIEDLADVVEPLAKFFNKFN